MDPCGYIDPEAPVVPLGSNFTAVCVLKEKCMRNFHVSADDIFWKTNHVAVPREQYAALNGTASSVTFTNVSLLNVQLTCNVRTFGQLDQNVYGVRLVAGRKCGSRLAPDSAPSAGGLGAGLRGARRPGGRDFRAQRWESAGSPEGL